MKSEALFPTTPPTVSDRGALCSPVALALACVLLAATFLLISPPPGRTYPGAIPWRAGSLLRQVTDWMSLGGVMASARGVEVKDLALHLAAAAGLLLTGVCTLRTRGADTGVRVSPVGLAQALLVGWGGISLVSSFWAADAAGARGQGLLYLLGLAWAIGVAATLRRRHVAAVLVGVLGAGVVGAALCVWYYYERNPHHRPGFPIGNPAALAASVVPTVLVALGLLAGRVAEWRRGGSASWWWALGGVVALVPLGWCLLLTNSRGALVGLGAGLAVMVLYCVGRRLRWALTSVLVVTGVVAGAWWLSISHLDVAMARGATIRIRLYAWRYASELWSQSSWAQLAGHGAGAYPRLAGALGVRDRALDPAAFMGESVLVEHAHNELFEVLTEVGVVGGVPYVGGFVATFFAFGALLRRTKTARERWLYAALAGGVAALLAESLTGVSLRLPGVPAIFYTLLGAAWAACRTLPEDDAGTPPSTATPGRPSVALLAGVACLAAGGAAGWLTFQNWRGVRAEQAIQTAFSERRYEAALRGALVAGQDLLDPTRRLLAAQTALECRYALAQQAATACLTQTQAAADERSWLEAIHRAHEAYTEAMELGSSAPALMRTDKVAARSAEWLAEIYRRVAPERAGVWSSAAEQAWRRQRARTPFDVDTLLGLVGYSPGVEARIGLLRDALRSLSVLPFEDESERLAQRYWGAVLSHLSQEPRFAPTLARFAGVMAPITPETDVDAIIASMAPETCRLIAAWHALQSEFPAAAEQAGRAVLLYRPLRPRFPRLEAVALSEQADYVLRGSAADAGRAVELLRQAIESLPVIQTHKYDEMAAPFRRQLAFCLLVQGQVDDALDALRKTLADEAVDSDELGQSVQRLLQAAAAAGHAVDVIARVREELCPRFSALCDGAR